MRSGRPGDWNTGEVDLPDGSRLAVDEWGAGAPACLFIHGFGDGAYVWEGVVSQLSGAGRCVAPDLRGHGRSYHDPNGRYRIGDHAGDVTALCQVAALDRVVLVGHSMGGAVAIHVAARGRVDVRALVLVDCGPPPTADVAAGLAAAASEAANATYANAEEYVSRVAEAQPLARKSELAFAAGRALRANGEGRLVSRRDPAMRPDPELTQPAERSAIWAALTSLECPILVVRGSASAVLDAATLRRMEDAGGDVTVRTVPGAGHAVMLDNPDGLAVAIDGFLPSVPR